MVFATSYKIRGYATVNTVNYPKEHLAYWTLYNYYDLRGSLLPRSIDLYTNGFEPPRAFKDSLGIPNPAIRTSRGRSWKKILGTPPSPTSRSRHIFKARETRTIHK